MKNPRQNITLRSTLRLTKLAMDNSYALELLEESMKRNSIHKIEDYDEYHAKNLIDLISRAINHRENCFSGLGFGDCWEWWKES